MSKANLEVETPESLLQRYVAISLDMFEAHRKFNTRGFNRLLPSLMAIEAELKARPGDQRRELVSLLSHENRQVRLNAARATLTITPREARATLEAIRDSKLMPQSLDAGMDLALIDEGIITPK